MPPKDTNISPIWFTNTETGESFKINELSKIELTIEPVTDEEDNDKVVFHYDREYGDKPITFTFEKSYVDLSVIISNNYLRRHGRKPLPYRKLSKCNKDRYALTIYNKQRKYVRDRYTFDEWKKKKGIIDKM